MIALAGRVARQIEELTLLFNSATGMVMFEIEVNGWFAAAHQLRLLDGRMEPLHGHNWQVRATFRGPQLDAMGVLLDFTRVQPALNEILASLHDQFLNELPAFATCNPSAENVARHIARELAQRIADATLYCVAVEESPGCTARYYPQ